MALSRNERTRREGPYTTKMSIMLGTQYECPAQGRAFAWQVV
jgi:hypothetical protein